MDMPFSSTEELVVQDRFERGERRDAIDKGEANTTDESTVSRAIRPQTLSVKPKKNFKNYFIFINGWKVTSVDVHKIVKTYSFLFCYLFSFTGKPSRGWGWNRFQGPTGWRRKLAFHYFSTIRVYAKHLLPCYQNSYTTSCFIQSATYVPIRWNFGAAFSESERSRTFADWTMKITSKLLFN